MAVYGSSKRNPVDWVVERTGTDTRGLPGIALDLGTRTRLVPNQLMLAGGGLAPAFNAKGEEVTASDGRTYSPLTWTFPRWTSLSGNRSLFSSIQVRGSTLPGFAGMRLT